MSKTPNVLLIEDDDIVFEFFNIAIGRKCQLHYSQDGEDFMERIKKHPMDAVFVDLNLPKITGHYIVEKIKEYDPSIPIVVISSTTYIQDAIKAFRLGVVDFLKKPFDDNDIANAFHSCLEQKELVTKARGFEEQVAKASTSIIVGNSEPMMNLKEDIAQLQDSTIDTLILGESGTGKEMVARSLHQQENDKNRPYITLNCSAIPHELIESVLFGHEKGSFTGAVKKQIGKFELSHGGDIFLDEIGTLPLDLQAKLLRVLQEREIEPVGLGFTKKLDFRVIAATNEDLVEMVKGKVFRKDLFYRLNKIVLRIPPLRERVSDIPELANFFVKKHSKNRAQKAISTRGMDMLLEHTWPGNVRELENVIENLVITTRGSEITDKEIKRFNFLADPFDDLEDTAQTSAVSNDGYVKILVEPVPTLSDATKVLEKALFTKALNEESSKAAMARTLGIDRKTLLNKMRILGLES
ncbi:hypothetical protein A9Q84_17010 [Halobacteriovorax marinus]|uniref:Sigma-54-dependent Fis family transcriptional regulator n=1 Tax=Halobacteriovorax marinus TaxID=97084 RepID=A0A1Y5F3I0_9BACT|nr:hypothetical protein A9Q84_17010 [Halobacteriovorax marinus]